MFSFGPYFKACCKASLLISLFVSTALKSEGTTNMTFPSGSYIVDMGIVPQTIGNAIKPYGLLWDVIEHHTVPVYWVINPTKMKDSTDFVYNGYSYKGGPFIIHADDIDTTIAARISYWNTQGVSGAYTTSSVTVPVYQEIKYYPRVLIDNLSGNAPIIEAYFSNAGIDSTGYKRGTPADATSCVDIWMNPHGDPVWSTHGPLYDFVTQHRGYIWSQCHAVSMLEDVVEPVSPYRQLNYLTTTGLQCWKGTAGGGCGPFPFTEAHAKKPNSPYTHSYPASPVMQFMDKAQSALTSNGSETWFIPLSGGAWRPSTLRTLTTNDGTSPAEGVLMAHGFAYGDSTNGMVCYAGGHDHQGGGQTAHQIAAQRAFFNFMYLSGKPSTMLPQITIDTVMTGLKWYTFSVSLPPGHSYTSVSWSSSIGGTFTHPDSLVTNFVPPNLSGPVQGTITCIVNDSCTRVAAVTQTFTLTPSPLPVSLIHFSADPDGPEKVRSLWITESETNNKYFTLSRSADGMNYVDIAELPSQGNGVGIREYEFTDNKPLNGISYYRLKQTDINGETTSFKPVMVKRRGSLITDPVAVIPNPFTDHISLNIVGYGSNTELKVYLIDVLGKVIRTESFNLDSGENFLRMGNLEHLTPGNYLLKLVDEYQMTQYMRIVK